MDILLEFLLYFLNTIITEIWLEYSSRILVPMGQLFNLIYDLMYENIP